MDTRIRIYQDLISRGMDPKVAAGWVGNWDVESSGFTQMQEQNPLKGEGGYGWGQWTGPRRQAFLEYANNQHLAPTSYEANLGYALKEIEDGVHMPKGFNDILAAKAKTPSEAALMISQIAQRPNKDLAHNDRRMASAEELAKLGVTPIMPEQPEQPPSLVRAKETPLSMAPELPQQPKYQMPIKDFMSGAMKGGLAGMANPGYEDVSGYSDSRLQSLMGMLFNNAMGGQRSRKRVI